MFAGALEHELPYGAGLYRIGGDEFVVLLDSRDGERLNELVDTALLAARQVVAGTVGASMGVADSREATRGTLLELADKRMYSIKQRRKAQAAPDSLPSSES
ncbi:diguanylate cyclase domain-containing protein [Deinococcus cavernae]|uniref:diguanylate cyclase domain-containing protein n=1 Tax=Deinococcus cavernae TaxID=2320857 RepID=UPI001F2E8836|nr:diguanylate cyclase [Deinococcus cavernae]